MLTTKMTQQEKDDMIWEMVVEHYMNKHPEILGWWNVLDGTNAPKMMLRLGMSEEYLEAAYMEI